ncbi:DUF5684 domain-containing protein [Microbacterium sp. NPDC058342]|uniref:DUF5684 domain-containing protein n=1 Tax=Microbacterium sp. NPDC058342 TaxID=3346454 RepID=UPI00364EDB62
MNPLAQPRLAETVVDTVMLWMLPVMVVGVIVGAALYVWYAIALSKLFPRLGAPGWKGWVPILNEATILSLGGKPAWNVVFLLIPVVQLYGLYLKAVAAHRINERFGRGAGTTVLAVLLPPVWATLLARGVPPYPEGDRLAELWPVARRESSPPAGHAPVAPTPTLHSGQEGYLAAPILPPRSTPPEATPPVPARSRADDQLIVSVPGMPSHEPSAPPVPSPSAGAAPIDPEPSPPREERPAPPAAPVPPQAPTGALESDAADLDTVDLASLSAPSIFAAPASRADRAASGPSAQAPHIRPAPVVRPDASAASVPPVPSAGAEPEQDDVEATVVVPRRRGARRVLVLDDGRRFALSSTSVVIGRSPEGEQGEQRLSIPDRTRTLSKTHARLVVHGEEWRLTDLHSTNGVVVVADDGAETLLDPGESVIGAGRFILGEVGMHVAVESGS